MRVFVTGGTGFIGSAVVRALVSSGHTVVCLVRERSRTDRIDNLALERVHGDVREIESLRQPIGSCDATIHLAAPGGWGKDRPSLLAAVIEGGTRNVLDAASTVRAHRIVVVSSTAAVDASDDGRISNEDSPFSVREPSLHYAHAKHRAEQLARAAAARGQPVVIVNPAEVYGPGDTELVTAGNLVDFATSMPVLVCDGGTSVVHVDDVVSGILAALQRGRVGERYILAGENLTIRQLAELVLELLGRRAPIVAVPNGLARIVARAAGWSGLPVPFNPHVVPYATRYWFVDNGKARRELGVSFRSARETVLLTLNWLRLGGHL